MGLTPKSAITPSFRFRHTRTPPSRINDHLRYSHRIKAVVGNREVSIQLVQPVCSLFPNPPHHNSFHNSSVTVASEKGFDTCCFKSFTWDGTPTGQESTLAENPTYITGTNEHSAVLFVHDALGWKFSNARLLADHFAKEVCFFPPYLCISQRDLYPNDLASSRQT
jgi:hypothetical protein